MLMTARIISSFDGKTGVTRPVGDLRRAVIGRIPSHAQYFEFRRSFATLVNDGTLLLHVYGDGVDDMTGVSLCLNPQ
jgi:hypothetical protein